MTSKSIFPKRRFIGAGITVDLHERVGSNTAPAAAAAESLINSRRVSMVFLFGVDMTALVLILGTLYKTKEFKNIKNATC